ncbi:MAG: capsular biosynthesis protein [Gammaproteobacteria bacterium]|nr:capsular biosynthesis protein [Gammaproteobacteria bacterium]
MAKINKRKDFLKIIGLLALNFLILGCSIGTSFKSNEIRSFKGTIIPELSSEPILIEKVSIDLIKKEKNKEPLNLPLSLLNYSPESYKVGAGDVLFIYVYGETERLSAALARGAAINPVFEKIVRDDGSIFYPNAGILDVAGKTVEEIRLLLTSSLSNVLNNPQVDVSVSEFNSQKIVISGSFSNVGTVPVTSVPQTLSEVIANANPFSMNGLRSLGDLTSVKFTRDGYTYDIDYEYLARNSQIQNYIYLKAGDVIHLPDNSLSQVHVIGEASNPISISLTRKSIPLSVALAQAKGLNQSTSKGKDVYILRPKDFEGKPRIFKSDMSSPSGYLVAGEFNLQAQDIVFVGTAGVTSWSRFINQVIPFTNFINQAEDTDLIKN